MYVCMYVCVCIYIYIYVCVCVCVCVCIYIYIYVCMYVCIHTHESFQGFGINCMEQCGLDSSGPGCGEMAGSFEKDKKALRCIK